MSADLSEIAEGAEEIYEVGRIYKLVSDNGLVYVGSTSKTLKERLRKHKNHFNSNLYCTKGHVTSFRLFEDGSNVLIELIEQHNDICKIDLHKRERYYIENCDCVNKFIPGRSHAESVKEHYEKNKIEILEKTKKYYDSNKSKILEQKKAKVKCEVCDCEINKCAIMRHERTKKHITNNITYNISNSTVNITAPADKC